MGYIIDISKWNKNINWDIAAQHIDLAICRVQYGSRKIDEIYTDHVEHLEARGIPHAAYAYGCYVSVADAIVEAKDFMNRVSPNAKFLVLDVENDTLTSCGAANLAEASQTFIDTCKEDGWKVGLYVSHYMYGSYGLQNVSADFIWLPRYGTNDGTPQVKPDYASDLWQYSDNGYVEGIGKVDVNLLTGDKLLEWFIGTESYRIYVGDFNSIEWTADVLRKIKETLPGYGVWVQCLDDGNHRIVVGDFNSKTWCDETFSKLKAVYPRYGMWISEM
ncbi:GH25 family lysozyme [Bacillus sp. GB_SG_008]|uniref:GH25 family lysozyme n=1 Tax=Bacillus sp. GB_SG_008 TaxID=3454627 RepID=UPI003F85CFEE